MVKKQINKYMYIMYIEMPLIIICILYVYIYIYAIHRRMGRKTQLQGTWGTGRATSLANVDRTGET